jgi:hypothetical protein
VISTTAHTLTFPVAPGKPWSGAVLTTADVVIPPVPLAPGVYPLNSKMTVVTGGRGSLRTGRGSIIDLTSPNGGVARWTLSGTVCFG